MPVNRCFKPETSRRRCGRSSAGRLDSIPGLPLLTLPYQSGNPVIARARLLVADPNYPLPHVINAVADLMARHVRV